jgi:hypothetical protein
MAKTKILFFAIFLTVICLSVNVNFVYAYTIENLNIQNQGDIVVGPGKTEVLMSPGDNYTKEMLITNRSGVEKIIDISIEDFQGTNDPNETLQFLGDKKGPYSLKDYVKPEITHINLKNGQRLRLPVVISIPATAAPGGLYGAAMVSASNLEEASGTVADNSAASRVKVITRIASLFFVRIKGDVINEGSLKDFKTEKSFYEAGPVNFQILFENKGSVYLSPYGSIEIKNILGQKIDERQVDPWFVLPGSTRERIIKWNSNFLFGRYSATLIMNRGYNDIIDSKTFAFWVIPWKIISIILIGLILIIWFFVWILSHIQWRKDKIIPPPPPVPESHEQKI